MSHQPRQIAAALQRAVQHVLTRGLNDPRIRGLLSVTRVELSPDLAQATIFVSVLPAKHADLSLHGLRHATAFVRTKVGDLVRIRRMPKFVFRLDESIKKQSDVFAAIARATGSDAPAGSEADSESAADTDAPSTPPSSEVSPT